MKIPAISFILCSVLAGCGAGKLSVSANKKFSPRQLQKDYSLYQEILEAHHPGLYWYTPKDSMDYFFKQGKDQLKDSLTEPDFRKILSFVTAKIDCGHTSVKSSKKWNRYRDTASYARIFPLSIKAWPDTMVVTLNLNRKDTILKRGTVITGINEKPITKILDTLFEYISTDGYNLTHKYQALSNRGYFGSLYTSVFGLFEKYSINYIDSSGLIQTVIIPAYNPAKDSIGRRRLREFRQLPKPSKKERKREQLDNVRLLQLDSVAKTALMELSTFGRGYKLRSFYRHSFKALRKNKIGHLIIDVRNNGGGSVNNSTLVSKYIADTHFKVADSLYAIRKKSRYLRYIEDHFWNKLFINFFTKKNKDGHYHFGYFERHFFKPKKKNHFDGKVYILTGGNSFSATTLFTSSLIKQQNVTVVGEETGGGAYGNSAWLIPDVTLPETGVRFRLPLFRLVIDKDIPKNGRGVQPEVTAKPTVKSIRQNIDVKIAKAIELIEKDKTKNE